MIAKSLYKDFKYILHNGNLFAFHIAILRIWTVIFSWN